MTQITLQFENNSIKNHFLKIIELMNGVTVVNPQPKSKVKKSGLDEALEDVEAGRVYKAKSVEDLFEQLKNWCIQLNILANSRNPLNSDLF